MKLTCAWTGKYLKIVQDARFDAPVWAKTIDLIRNVLRQVGLEPLDEDLENGEAHYVRCEELTQAVAMVNLLIQKRRSISDDMEICGTTAMSIELLDDHTNDFQRADPWRRLIDSGLLPIINQMMVDTGWQLVEAGKEESGDTIVQPVVCNENVWSHYQAIMKEFDD